MNSRGHIKSGGTRAPNHLQTFEREGSKPRIGWLEWDSMTALTIPPSGLLLEQLDWQVLPREGPFPSLRT